MTCWRAIPLIGLACSLGACTNEGNGAGGDGSSGGDALPTFCGAATYTAPTGEFFSDISDASGIRDENFDPAPTITITINDHSVVGFVDINGDGYDDIIATNLWANIYPQWNGEKPQEHLVFLNNGDRTFDNFTDASGLRDVDAGFFAYGDVDNDGDADVFAGYAIQTPVHRHSLWLNDGEGHFTQKTNAGFTRDANHATAGILADFNNDANLDLFIGNGHTIAAVPDELYLGNGDGTFTETSSNLGENPPSVSDGAVACDYDNDGDLDIFVATYGVSYANGHNLLWRNNGAGQFTELGELKGFAYQKTGNYFLASTNNGYAEQTPIDNGWVGSNAFGIDCADANNDGYLDIVISAISHPVDSDFSRKWSDPSQLLINQGPEEGFTLVNEFLARSLKFNEGDSDASFTDFDNDGLTDVAFSRGKKYEASYVGDERKGYFGLFHQQSDGKFDSVGLTSGINDLDDTELCRMGDAQSHAWSDIDLDGDLDLLVGGRRADCPGLVGRPNFLFENQIGAQNAWIAFRLRGDGVGISRDPVGSRVILRFADETLSREVKTNQGNWNPSDTRTLYFGLGERDLCAAEIEVRWVGGETESFAGTDFEPRQIHVIEY